MNLSWLQSAMMGFVSGFSEPLPMSAEAHRGLLRQCFGVESEGPLFLLMCHIAVLAVILMTGRLELNRLRMECMAEDTVAGRIQDYLDNLDGDFVCTLQIFKEGLDHPYDEPKRSDTNEVNEIMNNVVIGWKTGPTHRFSKYGIQRSWIRVSERTAKPSLRGSAIHTERRQPDVNERCKRTVPKPKFPDDFREVEDPDNPFTEQCRINMPGSP